MPDFSLLFDGQCYEDEGAVSATSAGTAVTSSPTANTWGSWTQLVASTGFYANTLILSCQYLNGTGTPAANILCEIGIGASLSEVTLVPTVQLSYINFSFSYPVYLGFRAVLPVSIPAGTRLSARTMAPTSTSGVTSYLTAMIVGGGFNQSSSLGNAIEAYGVGSGPSVVPACTVTTVSTNTYSSWVSLGTTSYDICALMLELFNAGSSSSTLGLLSIGIGAGGSQVVVANNVPFIFDTSGLIKPQILGPLPVNIPAGTQIWVRMQTNSSAAMAVVGHGFAF